MMAGAVKAPTRGIAQRIGAALAVASVGAGLACDGAPSSPSGDANVQLDLAPYFAGLGAGRAGPCNEADRAFLLVTQLEHDSIERRFSDSVPQGSCIVRFTVTVQGGDTRFETLVTGDGRPLFTDDQTIDIQRSGWSLEVRLEPVPALTVTVNGLDPAAAARSFDYTVTTEDSPPEGYEFSVNGGETDTVFALSAGPATVELDSGGCMVAPPGAEQSVNLPRDPTLPLRNVTFDVDCSVPPMPMTGTVRVTTVTTGMAGPMDYVLVVDTITTTIGRSATKPVMDVPVGDQPVKLTNVVGCSVTPADSQLVRVVKDSTTDVMFTINANTPCGGGLGSLGVITNTIGPDTLNYEFRVSRVPVVAPPDTIEPIAANDTVVIDGLLPGLRQVELVNTAPCLVTPANPDTADVMADATVYVVFDVDCTTQIEVTTITVGVDQDPDGYKVMVVDSSMSFVDSTHADINDRVFFRNVSPGSYTVTLSDIASNCVLSPTTPGNSQTKDVGPIGTTHFGFEVICSPLTSIVPGDISNAVTSQARHTGAEFLRHYAFRSRRSS